MSSLIISENSIQQGSLPSETLAQALLCDDAKLAAYVTQHLPIKTYMAVNVSTIKRDVPGAPSKVYKVICLSLNPSQGEASIMGSMAEWLFRSEVPREIDRNALGTEIMNGLSGIYPLNHQKVKEAGARLKEIRLLIERENAENFEVDTVLRS